MRYTEQKPIVTLVHSLPGRLRMRLSHAPNDPDTLTEFLAEHDGMGEIQYTPGSSSLLVHYEPHAISSEEITLRTAFRYAMDLGNERVRLLTVPDYTPLHQSAVVAGLGLLTALGLKWLRPESTHSPTWERVAGLGTAWSVVDHGWRELRQRGYVDPEVLALAYLATALVRGNVLTASFVTWFATFGRHLIEMPSTGVQVEPVPIRAQAGGEGGYELVVRPDTDASDRFGQGTAGMLNSALRYAMSGGGTHGLKSFWEELRDVSKIHGEVLEGYSRQTDGIPIRFR